MVSVSTYYLHPKTSEVFIFRYLTRPLVKNFYGCQVIHPSLKETVPTASLPSKVSTALNEEARLALTPAQCEGAERGGGQLSARPPLLFHLGEGREELMEFFIAVVTLHIF